MFLNQLLAALTTRDAALQLAHLLGVFYLMEAFDAQSIGSTAKFVFASRMAGMFSQDRALGIQFGLALRAHMRLLDGAPKLQACAEMVVIQLGIQWFESVIPAGLEFPTMLLVLYMLQHTRAPLTGDLYASRPA